MGLVKKKRFSINLASNWFFLSFFFSFFVAGGGGYNETDPVFQLGTEDSQPTLSQSPVKTLFFSLSSEHGHPVNRTRNRVVPASLQENGYFWSL